MEQRQLGNTGLMVSAFALGTASFGGYREMGEADPAEARRQVDIALDAGITVFDTADAYGCGAAETALARALGNRRDRVLIMSKVFARMGDGPNDVGLSRKHIIEACEGSLRRLGTGYLDIYHVHGWDGITPVEETLSALDHLVQQGKVRYIGTSNFSGWQVMKANAVADNQRLQRFVSQQIHYSLQAREAEYELVPIALDQGVGIIVWSPLGGGLLSGKWRRDTTPPEGSRRLQGWPDPPIYDVDKLWDTIDVLVKLSEERGVTVAEVALAWVKDQPGVSSVILGARTSKQLAVNLGAADIRLTQDELSLLDAASAPNLLYPYWWQAKYNERLGPAERAVLARYVNQEPSEGSAHRPLPGFGVIPE